MKNSSNLAWVSMYLGDFFWSAGVDSISFGNYTTQLNLTYADQFSFYAIFDTGTSYVYAPS
jgi:hypothetical protein